MILDFSRISKQNEARKHREKRFLESELRRFEKFLHENRPKFQERRKCLKKFQIESNNDDFWDQVLSHNVISNPSPKIVDDDTNVSYCETIKITITDKPIDASTERNSIILKKTLRILMEYAQNRKRLREIKLQVIVQIIKKFIKMRKIVENVFPGAKNALPKVVAQIFQQVEKLGSWNEKVGFEETRVQGNVPRKKNPTFRICDSPKAARVIENWKNLQRQKTSRPKIENSLPPNFSRGLGTLSTRGPKKDHRHAEKETGGAEKIDRRDEVQSSGNERCELE